MRMLLGLVVLAVACGAPREPKKIDWVMAPEGEVASLVAAQAAHASADGRRVVVYVGATWCEPCRRFHEAVKRGSLDRQFGQLRFVEFDLDRDRERLSAAGYESKFIPLLALPDATGHASGKQMAGSVKGDGAVDEMVPRLVALLAP